MIKENKAGQITKYFTWKNIQNYRVPWTASQSLKSRKLASSHSEKMLSFKPQNLHLCLGSLLKDEGTDKTSKMRFYKLPAEVASFLKKRKIWKK